MRAFSGVLSLDDTFVLGEMVKSEFRLVISLLITRIL